MQSSKSAALTQFDQEEHKGNAYQAFQEHLARYAYEYDAVSKEPPKELVTDARAAWIEQNKRKLYLGRYASSNLQRAFEEVTTETERSTITFTDMKTKLEAHFKTGSNTTLANFEFRKLYQKDGESFEVFANRVTHDSRNCDFTCASNNCTVRATLAQDQIITGTTSDEIHKHALKNQWGLDDLIKNGRQLEAASSGVIKMKNSKQHNEEASSSKAYRNKRPGKYSNKNTRNFEKKSVKKCPNCSAKACPGGKKCPGTKIECFDCGKKGHFRNAESCSKRNSKKKPTRRVETDDEESSSDSSSESHTESEESSSSSDDNKRSFRLSARHVKKVRRMRLKRSVRRSNNSKRYEVNVIIKETSVKAFADTGSDICITSKKKSKELGLKLQKTRMSILPYGSKKMKCVGYAVATVMYGDRVANIGIYVINKDVETLLSGPVAEELGIISFNGDSVSEIPEEAGNIRSVEEDLDPFKMQIKSKYPNLSSGKVGKLRDYVVKYYVDESVPPVAEPRRPIAYHLQDKFEREIQCMVDEGICSEHHGPAERVSNPVLQPKADGGMRVTVDMKNVNKAIKQTNIPIPRVEDIKARLANCKVFSKLDFKSAFFQLELDEESKRLTVFHAGNRLMRLNRLVQGCSPSSGELSKALAPLFMSLPQVHMIHDDLVVATATQQEHEVVLNKVLQIIEDSGMTLNLSKCLFFKDEIPFWGLIVSKDGLKPDPKKVESLRQASPPTSKAELSSFLCMIQSNKDFIPNLASKTQHLRKRLKKHCRFSWDKHCQKEFDELKATFTESCLLHHYDPSANTYIWVDAHRTGISAILMQGDDKDSAKPIAFASRTTTQAEKRYPQLDLEALSVDFGLRRFRFYIVGGPTVGIVTDHKPLVSIFANKRKGSIRTTRIKLRHQDVNYLVMWKKGCNNPADYLSRHATPRGKLSKKIQEESEEFEKTVWYLHFNPYMESIAMERIIEETAKDPVLCQLKRHLKKGHIPVSLQELSPYRKVIDQITISDEGLLMKDEKIILPDALCHLAIKKAHQGAHPGMNGMKRRLRTHFWFPKMDKVIENFVNNCENCQIFTNKRTKEPLTPIMSSKKPWNDVSIDLFGPMPDQKHVVVVLDSASRFPAAKIVPSTAAKPVLKAIDQIYSDYGQPSSHRTDNGPPFNSEEFTDYSVRKGIDHIKTYPYHPQANMAETFMKPLGKSMKSAHHHKTDKSVALNQLLTSYRSTPHPATGVPPGAAMFRNGYRTEFPNHDLSDECVLAAFNQDQAQKLERSQAINTSKHRLSSTLNIGDQVYMRNRRTSKFQPIFGPEKYTIINIGNGGATIQNNHDGTIFERHLDDLKNAPPSMDTEITWFPPNNHETSASAEPVADLPVNSPTEVTQPRRNPPRNARPPAYLNDYVQFITQV